MTIICLIIVTNCVQTYVSCISFYFEDQIMSNTTYYPIIMEGWMGAWEDPVQYQFNAWSLINICTHKNKIKQCIRVATSTYEFSCMGKAHHLTIQQQNAGEHSILHIYSKLSNF